MITAGAGTSAEDQDGEDRLFGGGIFAVDSKVRINRSPITHNTVPGISPPSDRAADVQIATPV